MLTTEQIKNLPVAPDRSRAVAGKDTLMFVALTKDPDEFVIVGGQKNSPITEKADSMDATDKTSGNFSKKLPGLHTWSIEYDGLWVVGDLGIDICRDRFKNNKPVYVRVEYPDGTYRVGWASITDLSDNNSSDSAQTIKMSLEGVGALSDMMSPSADPKITAPTVAIATSPADVVVNVTPVDIVPRMVLDQNGQPLAYGNDYSYAGGKLTFKKEFLKTITRACTFTVKFANDVNITLNVTKA